MPVSASAKKALRKNRRQERFNTNHKGRVHALVLKARKLIAAGKKEEAQKLLPTLYRVLDKAVKAGVFKRGHADRRKARLAVLVR